MATQIISELITVDRNFAVPTEIEVRIARSIAEVEALREAWAAWPGHRDSDMDFYLMINQAYPEILRPHVIALYRDGRPEAILVGRLDRKPIAFKVGYFRKIRVLARCLTFVYDPIHGNGSPENTKILLQEVMNCLNRNEADLASLEFVPVDSIIYDLALKLPNTLSRDTLPEAQGHESLIIPDSIDEVYRRMSSVRRKHLKASIRKLQNHPAGQVRIVGYRHEAELDQLFRDAEEIARKTYQRGLGAGFSDAPDTRMRLEMAARKGWLRANLLYLGDRPVAFWIGMLYHGSFVSEYMGYDPEFRQSSPGMVLIMHILEGFCARANGDIVKELDFGLGHAEYKTVLCSKSWQEARVYIFSPTIKGLLLKSIRTAAAIAENSARRLLLWAKLIPRFKRAWRDRLAKL
jgi:GNAT acetyltransferase-like protein